MISKIEEWKNLGLAQISKNNNSQLNSHFWAWEELGQSCDVLLFPELMGYCPVSAVVIMAFWPNCFLPFSLVIAGWLYTDVFCGLWYKELTCSGSTVDGTSRYSGVDGKMFRHRGIWWKVIWWRPPIVDWCSINCNGHLGQIPGLLHFLPHLSNLLRQLGN